ncbi:MAG: LamG domain-containing protein [Planctomycetes bacterium]|nr:LamG domain-containing protein [Planctomycetota bacterium]
MRGLALSIVGLLLVLMLAAGGPRTGDAAPRSPAGGLLESTGADPHLVGWWTLDETSGTTAKDGSGKGRNGKLLGGLTFEKDGVEGRRGRALKLDGGRESQVRIEGYKGVTGTGPRTVAVWMQTERARGQLLSWGKDDGGKMFILGFIRAGVGVTPKGGYLYTLDKVHDGKWHHVVAVVEKAELPNLHDDVKLYKDGEIAVIDDIGLLDLWPLETGDEQDVTIGSGYEGLIDDVRIYDRALSAEEVKALFEGKAAKKQP